MGTASVTPILVRSSSGAAPERSVKHLDRLPVPGTAEADNMQWNCQKADRPMRRKPTPPTPPEGRPFRRCQMADPSDVDPSDATQAPCRRCQKADLPISIASLRWSRPKSSVACCKLCSSIRSRLLYHQRAVRRSSSLPSAFSTTGFLLVVLFSQQPGMSSSRRRFVVVNHLFF